MTEFVNPWIVALAWTLLCVFGVAFIAVGTGKEEMGKLRRIK